MFSRACYDAERKATGYVWTALYFSTETHNVRSNRVRMGVEGVSVGLKGRGGVGGGSVKQCYFAGQGSLKVQNK